MIDRRELLTLGGFFGGLAGRGANADDAAYATAEISDRSAQDIVAALKAITTAMYAAQSFDAINPIRTRQIDYLKANNKFPDFIDVGVDVWMAVHDWQVRVQQPLVLGRDGSGRYTMTLEFTQLVLRPDTTPNFISPPYDAR
jgi:hypothetical protein